MKYRYKEHSFNRNPQKLLAGGGGLFHVVERHVCQPSKHEALARDTSVSLHPHFS
jgi:hypothetical protein